MRLVHSEKFKPKRLARVLAGFAQVSRERRNQAVLGACLLLGLATLLFIGGVSLEPSGEEDDPAAALIIIALFVAGLAMYVGNSSSRRRLDAKVDFVKALTRALVPDFMPGAKARVELDLRHYTVESKKWWTGRSPYGNAKAKYTDKWMSVSATLADGTRLLIRRQAGLKTKSGSIQKEKRRLWIRIKPNAAIYDVAKITSHLPGLRKSLKSTTRSLFVNAPEKFHVDAGAEGGVIKLKVSQEDTDYTPQEIVDLLTACMRFLARFDRRPQGGGVYR